jgi:ferredoxin
MEQKWKDGKYITVMFGIRPYVDAICLCDKYCARWWYPEIEWYAASFYVSKAYKPEKCDRCGTCLEKCLAGAIRVDDDGVYVDPMRCIGCSICVRYCPHGVFKLEPRRQYIDLSIGKRVTLKA